MAERMETPLQLASDIVYDCLCFGCKESGLQIEAPHFCKRCQRYFCENCVGLHNQLFKTHVVLGKGEKSHWSLAEAKLDYITKCEQHPKETIKLFCKGHKKLCCIYCLLSDHKICEDVVRIGEEAEEFDVEKDFENLPQNILARCETINSEHIEMEKQLETLQSSFDETLLEVASFQKKMTDAIEKLGQLSTSELKTMFTSIHETCINEIQRHSEMNQRYKLLQKGHESIKQDNKQLAFILCKKYDELYEETDSLYKRKDNREISFRFHAEASMLQLLSELASLGKVQTYKNESSKVIKVSEKTEFTISEVSETGMIIGICELANRKFIIAERSNAKTYLLDDSLKVVSHLYLKSHPQEMCNVSLYSVAVLLDDGDLLFIRINYHQMTTERILQLVKGCSGIGYHNNDIFVGKSTNIVHYSTAGKIKQEISLPRGFGKTI